MPDALDLNLLPVARIGGQEYPELMGLFVAEPPRRAARGRAADRLVLYLTMMGNAPLAPGKQEQALAYLADLYYKTPGSVTTGMRIVAEELNSLLQKRNLRVAGSGRQGIGVLVQGVLRAGQLYLAHSGPAHAYLITAGEVRHFHDEEMAGRGLGQGRTAPLCFFQANLRSDDTLLLAAQPSSEWNAAMLSGLYGQGPESLRRRLFGQPEVDLNAVLIQAKAGQGKLYMPKPKSEETAIEAEPVVGVPEVGAPTAGKPVARMTPEPAPISGVPEAAGEIHQARDPAPTAVAADAGATPAPRLSRPEALPSIDAGVVASKEGEQPHVAPSRPKFSLDPVWRFLVLLGTPLARLLQMLTRSVRAFFARLRARMPSEDIFQSIPVPVMVLIAMAVPAVVVTIGSVAYMRLGYDAQSDALFAQVQQKVVEAASQTDLLARRAAWEDVLEMLQPLGDDSRAEALRAEARYALDELDLVRRLDYQPVIGFSPQDNVRITRLVVAEGDVYMLESNSGTVLRAQWTGRDYSWDAAFQCGPSVAGVTLSGAIMDILAWPATFDPQASILAMDASGNLLYCLPNIEPEGKKLAVPPNMLFGDLLGFTEDLGNLYVLDPSSNAVWIYWGSKVGEEPYLFFDQQVPVMQTVVDLAVNNDELYLLHEDGHMTVCYYNGLEEALTRCTDQQYMDFRPGRENTPLVAPSPFEQVLHAPPPDPSLYLLEPEGRAIYHFSLRTLAFQRQFLPLDINKLPLGRATAFAVDPIRRNFFLAVGDQVFYAMMP